MQQVPWASQLSWVGARDHFPIGTATDSAATGWKLPCEHSSRRRYKTVPLARPVVVGVVPSSGTSSLDVVCGPDVPMATLPTVAAAVVATVGDSVGAGVAIRVRVVAAGLVAAVITAFAIVVADAVAVADAVFVAAAAVAKADVKSDDVVNGGDAASDAAHDCNAVGGSSAVAVPPDVGGVSVVSHCRPLKLYDRPDAAYHSTACAEYSCTSSTSTAEPESLCSPPQELSSGGTVTLQVERYNHNNIVIIPRKRAHGSTQPPTHCLLHHVGRRRHSHSD